MSVADTVEVHRFVRRRVANRADAADIAQQALLLAWAKRSTCRGESASAWLLTIARHLIVDHYRAKHRVRFVPVEDLAKTEPKLRTPSDTLTVVCECRSRVKAWLDCLDQRLRLEQQVALLLADVYGYTDKESALQLRMGVPSFKLLLHGTRVRLLDIGGGSCSLLKKDRPRACDGSANAPDCKGAGCGSHPAPSRPLTHRLGVVCGLSMRAVLDLQKRLLAGLEGPP